MRAARMGGVALLLAAVGFMGVFTYLAVRFNYPDVLDTPAAQALPALLSMGSAGRMVWALYGFLPLLLIPAAVGAAAALRTADQEDNMRLAVHLATAAAIFMMLGFLRWPSIHWELAKTFATAGSADQAVLATVFDGLNRYLGNYLGEFAGELCLNAFFVLSGKAMLRSPQFPRWMGWFGIASGVLGWIGMWRNVTGIVAPASALDNIVLPVWMITFGIALLRHGRSTTASFTRD